MVVVCLLYCLKLSPWNKRLWSYGTIFNYNFFTFIQTKIAQLESVVNKLRKEKEKAEKERSAALLKDDSKAGSFTPSQNEDSNSAASTKAAALAILNNNNSKPSSRTGN